MFLDNVDLKDVKVQALKLKMSNWVKVSELIYDGVTEEELLVMIKLEATSKKREYIMSRLHSRYNILRSKREQAELKEWLYSLQRVS